MKLGEVKEMLSGEGEREGEVGSEYKVSRCVQSLESLNSLKATLLQRQPDLKLDEA